MTQQIIPFGAPQWTEAEYISPQQRDMYITPFHRLDGVTFHIHNDGRINHVTEDHDPKLVGALHMSEDIIDFLTTNFPVGKDIDYEKMVVSIQELDAMYNIRGVFNTQFGGPYLSGTIGDTDPLNGSSHMMVSGIPTMTFEADRMFMEDSARIRPVSISSRAPQPEETENFEIVIEGARVALREAIDRGAAIDALNEPWRMKVEKITMNSNTVKERKNMEKTPENQREMLRRMMNNVKDNNTQRLALEDISEQFMLGKDENGTVPGESALMIITKPNADEHTTYEPTIGCIYEYYPYEDQEVIHVIIIKSERLKDEETDKSYYKIEYSVIGKNGLFIQPSTVGLPDRIQWFPHKDPDMLKIVPGATTRSLAYVDMSTIDPSRYNRPNGKPPITLEIARKLKKYDDLKKNTRDSGAQFNLKR